MKRTAAMRVLGASETDPGRRDFCRAAGALVAGAALLPACGGGGGQSGGNPVSGATVVSDTNAADLQVNDVDEIRVPEAFVDVCRDANGIYAMSAYCTHADCVISVDPNDTSAVPSFLCPCHQSTFDYNGTNTGGPAPKPLPHYLVTIDATGQITIDTGMVVDASTRVKLG